MFVKYILPHRSKELLTKHYLWIIVPATFNSIINPRGSNVCLHVSTSALGVVPQGCMDGHVLVKSSMQVSETANLKAEKHWTCFSWKYLISFCYICGYFVGCLAIWYIYISSSVFLCGYSSCVWIQSTDMKSLSAELGLEMHNQLLYASMRWFQHVRPQNLYHWLLQDEYTVMAA